jgi:hypothetical protein
MVLEDVLFSALSIFAKSIALAVGCVNSSKAFHDQLLCSLMQAPMSFFDTSPYWRILNR